MGCDVAVLSCVAFMCVCAQQPENVEDFYDVTVRAVMLHALLVDVGDDRAAKEEEEKSREAIVRRPMHTYTHTLTHTHTHACTAFLSDTHILTRMHTHTYSLTRSHAHTHALISFPHPVFTSAPFYSLCVSICFCIRQSVHVSVRPFIFLVLQLKRLARALKVEDSVYREISLKYAEKAKRAEVYIAQHSAAQHGTAQPNTAQRSPAQHSTAQHSTAQHSTAQHSTAQHSTAQHSTEYSSAYVTALRRVCMCSPSRPHPLCTG